MTDLDAYVDIWRITINLALPICRGVEGFRARIGGRPLHEAKLI